MGTYHDPSFVTLNGVPCLQCNVICVDCGILACLIVTTATEDTPETVHAMSLARRGDKPFTYRCLRCDQKARAACS